MLSVDPNAKSRDVTPISRIN
ncbi:hypothetical protein BIW11_04372 [Tropilaelaps mercedesae]|uniref:Uncharacterized protein n=1 Tax=Tropilaelaps mercedesae TaxID=418985 RepID=A0A1V9X7R2_9ACAR|nr:hypothetical protein BIW11_04372 [Tropilaelaps mercedesae]